MHTSTSDAGATSRFAQGSNLKALRQRASEIRNEFNALAVASTGRAMTAEERTKFDALKAEADTNRELLAVAEQLNADERTQAAIIDGDEHVADRAAKHAGLIVGVDRSTLDKTRGFKSIAHFARDVQAACVPGGRMSKMLATLFAAPTSVSQEGGTSEGYEVPAAFAEQIFQLVFAPDGLLEKVNPEPTAKNAVDIEGDETTPWGSSGVQAKWRAEGTQMVGSKASTNLRTVRLHELFAFVTASQELLEDGPRLNDRLTTKAAAAIKWKADEALMFGTGAGQPLGWMTAPSLVTVAAEGGQGTSTIVIANILKMFSRLLAQGGSPFWIVNRDTIPQLATIQIGNYPVFVPPMAGITQAPNGTLLGLPIMYSEHAQTLGTKGDVQLVNPFGYYATVKQSGDGGEGLPGLEFAQSIHLYFDYNLTAFRWTFRLGGQPYLSAAISPAKGSNTKSHFVTLAARP
jgi:HK97 family phage major capsid protein